MATWHAHRIVYRTRVQPVAPRAPLYAIRGITPPGVGLCICDLTFTSTLNLEVAFDPALNLTVDFTPPCDC